MGLDQLLDLTSQVATRVLPILGVIVLVFLAVFIKHLITVMKKADAALSSMKTTMDTTNRQLESLDKPLQTLQEVSDTVDYVHEASKHAVRSGLVCIIDNFSSIKEWATNVGSKKKAAKTDMEQTEGE